MAESCDMVTDCKTDMKWKADDGKVKTDGDIAQPPP